MHVLERSDLDDAGVVDQHVDAPGARDDIVDQALRVIAVRHVADEGGDVEAAAGGARGGAMEFCFAPRGDGAARAVLPEFTREERAGAARPAGNDGRAVPEIERARL